MKPEYVDNPNDEKYVYAKCMCPVPDNYAIKIPRVEGQDSYHFKCEICGCEGDVKTKQVEPCELLNICNYKTAVCQVAQPDEGCYYYRYFKKLIEKE